MELPTNPGALTHHSCADSKNASMYHYALESRKNLFDTYTCKLNNDPKVKNQILAKIFEGYSGDVCQSAQLSSVTEMFNSVGYREPTENEEHILGL